MSEPRRDGREPKRRSFVEAHSAKRNAIKEQFPTINFPGPEPVDYLRLGPQLELMKYALMWAETHAPELYTELDRVISLMHPYVRLQHWDSELVDNAVGGFTDKLADDDTLADQEHLFAQTLQKNPQVLAKLPSTGIGLGVVHLHALIEVMHATPPTRQRHLSVADLGPLAGMLTTMSSASAERVQADPLLANLQQFAQHEWAARANEGTSLAHWIERMLAELKLARMVDSRVNEYVGRYLTSTITLLRNPTIDKQRTQHQLSVVVKPVEILQRLAEDVRERLDGLLKELDQLHFNIKFAAGYGAGLPTRVLAETLCWVHTDCNTLSTQSDSGA